MKNGLITALMGSILAGQSVIRKAAVQQCMNTDPFQPRNRQERRAARKNLKRI